MFKVVIIDDEPAIVKGLSQAISWEKYHCKIVGTAYDGQEGLKVIRKYQPDIIFSDISMPGMDGLKMIAAIRGEYPDTMISILTGTRNFDYVQKAIKLGVCRFLLKPSSLSELEEAVQYMAATLEKREQFQAERAVLGSASEESVAEEEPGCAGSFIVKNALDYLKVHYAEKITLGELADKMFVSQWYLSKILNRHTKKNFSRLLNEVRVKEAKELLKDHTLRVGDVAERVGFPETAHFSRVFKKYTGMSANEYRNKKLG